MYIDIHYIYVYVYVYHCVLDCFASTIQILAWCERSHFLTFTDSHFSITVALALPPVNGYSIHFSLSLFRAQHRVILEGLVFLTSKFTSSSSDFFCQPQFFLHAHAHTHDILSLSSLNWGVFAKLTYVDFTLGIVTVISTLTLIPKWIYCGDSASSLFKL